jgi:signal transduction histidine kinase
MILFGKIGARLLRWFLVIALIPLIFMGYQGYYLARRAVQHEVYLHMEAIARQKMMRIDQWFSERTNDIKTLAANPDIAADISIMDKRLEQSRRDDIINILNHYRKESESYYLLGVYNKKGNAVVQSSKGELQIAGLGLSNVIREALHSDTPVMSPVQYYKDIGAGMQLADAIRDPMGDPLGVLVAVLSLSNTLNPIILDTTGLGQTGQAYLVDSARVMLTPSRFMSHPQPLTHTMDSEAIRHAIAGHSGSGVYPGYEGQQVIGAWVYMPIQKWALIAEMDAKEAFAPLATIRRITIIMSAVVLAVILIVVVAISRSLSRPIRQLANASLEVSKGNLDTSVAVKLNDELGYLAEHFNYMVRSMKESQESLQNAYEQLLRTQKRLVQSEKLAAVGQLVASVVHEIRNPLSAVKMNLSILESKCSGDKVIAEHFQLAKSQTERLESMLTELLDYSKPVSLNLTPIAIGDLVDQAVRELQPGSIIDVRLHDPTMMIRVDTEKMHQVLLNILLNAIQAIDSDGKIIIASAAVDFEGIPAVRLSISDNGHGIAKDNVDKVLEPFFTTRKQGTGLGLPNAKKIIEAHGGDMTIRSEIGKGTDVIITLTEGA